MKGFIKQIAAALSFGAALFTMFGCYHYRNHVDPCWPERYSSIARHNVRAMHIVQADQGHKLDQTIWNSHFVEGTAILNDSGVKHLRYIAQRTPCPDRQLWLQYPHDVKEDKRVVNGVHINDRRIATIRAYLDRNTLASNGAGYQIDVHDLPQPTYPANWTQGALENVEKGIKSGTPQTFPVSSGSGK